MPLTLEQYAAWLDGRKLAWPPPPEVKRPKARPHVAVLPGLRAVVWNVYGTLIAINGGDLLLEHPQPFITMNAMDRTVQEFKMWGSMTRTPTPPAEYLLGVYRQLILEQQTAVSGHERNPETDVARVWETILKRLIQKDYTFDAGFYGSLNEFSRKVAYFYSASMQGYAAQADAADVLRQIAAKGIRQAIAADGQCFSAVQLQRALSASGGGLALAAVVPEDARTWSSEVLARSESERLLRRALEPLLADGIGPGETLYVSSRLPSLTTAKRLGMRTAIFAGDKASLVAKPAQLLEPSQRPDILFTRLPQLLDALV